MSRIEAYPYAAKNFGDAYANTNYLQPLRGEALDKFYVDRGVHSELKALVGELEAGAQSTSNAKFLFVGHTGCGKSTELSRLVSIIEGPEGRSSSLHNLFLPIQYSVSEVVGLYNIEFVDIALSMVVGIYSAVEALGHNVDDAPARRVYHWLYQDYNDLRAKRRITRGDLDDRLGLSGLIKLIDIRLKGEGEVRDEIRLRVKKFIPELIGLINQVIDEVTGVTGKNVLLIIDDLDKIQPLEDALKVFREHVKSLTSLNCFAIYTAPISLLYDPACKHVGQFLDVRYMPMFRVRTKDGEREPPVGSDVELLREIIHRRVHPTLFEEGVVDEAVDMTGGILRELIRIIRGCCVYCQEYGIGKVTHNVLQKQKSKLKGEYYRMLGHEDYQSLRRVRLTRSRADVDMRHLESLCVLYYPNDKGWFDVHPIVRELLEEWERETQIPASG
jgi:energy-coupling factor transporter ATP-binding protein EcfA2